MSIYKIPLPLNILEAARERITWTLNTLPRVCVSFSGGKDSGLMLHLTAELARQMGKKICVLFIDWEAQFSCTIKEGANKQVISSQADSLIKISRIWAD
ncbi:phosphoadenosine phosphosulfate reductase family protein, partial [Escherichia coli]|uniref:phosphoadenosine phosphosulfate reductase domain-containing protein n=1 Tax=Escherichia coli TaxID=562 RepID=UPI001F116E3C